MQNQLENVSTVNAEEIVLRVLEENLLYDGKIKLDNTYAEIGLDSLLFINIVVNIETECKVVFEDNMLVYDENKTVKNLIDCVYQLIDEEAVQQ